MKIHSDAIGDEVRIEIIPLLDVIFCILTFFILGAVGLSRQQAINLDLPQASTGEAQMRAILPVSVDPLGQIYIEKQPVNQAQLMRVLEAYQTQNPEGLMVLYAHPMSSYNDVVQVLDILREVGGDRVGLATIPKPEDEGGNANEFAPITPIDPRRLPAPPAPPDRPEVPDTGELGD